MAAKIIDGRAMAEEMRAEIGADVAALRAERGITPRIAFVLVGDDPGSRYYVASKGKAAAALGMESEDHHLSADVPEAELLTLIATLNGRPEVHGILVQMPVPPHMDKQRVLMAVDPRKDVDGLHPL